MADQDANEITGDRGNAPTNRGRNIAKIATRRGRVNSEGDEFLGEITSETLSGYNFGARYASNTNNPSVELTSRIEGFESAGPGEVDSEPTEKQGPYQCLLAERVTHHR